MDESSKKESLFLAGDKPGAGSRENEHKLPLTDAWVIWFLLGVVMINYPFLHIFNKNVQVFGIPLTILYFFVGWPVSIFVIYLFSIYLSHDTARQSAQANQQEDSGEDVT